MTRELDIILFGATGITGKHAIPIIAKFAKNYQLTWGVAGRSEEKIKAILSKCEASIGASLSQIPVIIASVNNEKSLKEMARQTRVIVNCCGPYVLLGEPVVKACVEEGAHHVDVSGEPQYMEKIQLKYHEQAKEKGVYIISACGLDSIPPDLGVVFLNDKFKGTLNSVETYSEFWEEGNAVSGPSLNLGTWESAIYVMANIKELRQIRTQLYPKLLPKLEPKLSLKYYPRQNNLVKGWILPFLGSDRSVVRRSQFYFYQNDSQRPIQAQTYLTIPSISTIMFLSLIGIFVSILSRFSFGRSLLLKYPELFSFGLVTRDPPSETKIEKTHFAVTLHGKGWKETSSDPGQKFSTPPNKTLTVRVTGKNPAYGFTCVALVLCAITILKETEKLPSSGGVYPPGYAFAKTSLVEKLGQNGAKFEVLEESN